MSQSTKPRQLNYHGRKPVLSRILPASVSRLPSATVSSLSPPSRGCTPPIAAMTSSPSPPRSLAQVPGLTLNTLTPSSELVVPVQHEHAHRRLAAAVPDRFEADVLGPACWLRWCREVAPGRGRHLRQACDNEDAGATGIQEEGHEFPCHDVCSRHIDVVGLVEAVPQRHFALDKVVVNSGAC